MENHLHKQLVASSLIKDKHSCVFEYETHLINSCNVYACICMLIVCGSILFTLCMFIYVLHTYFTCHEFVNFIWYPNQCNVSPDGQIRWGGGYTLEVLYSLYSRKNFLIYLKSFVDWLCFIPYFHVPSTSIKIKCDECIYIYK